MTLSFAPNTETELLIEKADNGCFESQVLVGSYYLGTKYLPDDTAKSYHYYAQFLSHDIETVQKAKLVSPLMYGRIMALTGLLALNLDKFQEAKQHYLATLDYANRYLSTQERQKMVDKYNIHQRLNEIEKIENGTLIVRPTPVDN